MNGDSFFDLDLKAMYQFHQTTKADCSLTLKSMENFDRYGTVEMNKQNRITLFTEKQFCEHGLIYSGISILNKSIFKNSTASLSQSFSCEKDLALLVKGITGFEGNIIWDTTKQDGTPKKLMDVSKINKLGWKASIGLEEGIRKIYLEIKDTDWN